MIVTNDFEHCYGSGLVLRQKYFENLQLFRPSTVGLTRGDSTFEIYLRSKTQVLSLCWPCVDILNLARTISTWRHWGKLLYKFILAFVKIGCFVHILCTQGVNLIVLLIDQCWYQHKTNFNLWGCSPELQHL